MVASSKGGHPKPPPFHDAELRRGWRLLRTSMAITADPARRSLQGTATISVAALNVNCISIDLHVRRGVQVRSVCMRGAPAQFNVTDVSGDEERLAKVCDEVQRTRVDEVQQAQEDALRTRADIAEMSVYLPPDISADVIDVLDALTSSDAAAAAAAAVAAAANGGLPLPPPVHSMEDLPGVELVVEWEVVEGSGAVTFGVDGEDAMLVDGRVGRARCWMPCVDTLNWCDRCPWEITISAPLESVVVCSGDLTESVVVSGPQDEPGGGDEVVRMDVDTDHAENAVHGSSRLGERRLRSNGSSGPAHSGRMTISGEELAPLKSLYPAKRFVYHLKEATLAGDIAMAVGPFSPLADPQTPTSVTHFCLPGKARDLVHTVPGVFSKVRAFCADYFNCDLTLGRSIKQVFAGESASFGGPSLPHSAAGGLIIYPSSLLHNARCIDEGFDARSAMTAGIVSTYLGFMIRPQSPEDAWFVAGLASHVSARANSSLLGKNWYRVHINDEVRVMAEESGKDSPVLAEVDKDPMFSIEKTTPSVRRRAHLIVYSVERRIGGDVLRRALREVIAELNRAITGGNQYEDVLLGLSVGPFLKRVRAICGTDVRNLVRAWAASRGMPRMRFGYRYNVRRHQTEFAIDQKATGHLETLSRAREGLLFQGPLCVRVMEPEGSFDHTVEVIDPVFVSELSCHCRRTKQKPATQAEKDAGEEPARIAPISWVRVDPDMEWCIDVSFVQPEEAWIVMLHGERDAVAQINACRGLAEFETTTAAKALGESLGNNELYWRVRAEAARALSSCEGGLFLLFEYFRAAYCVNEPGDIKSQEPAPGGERVQNGGGKRVVAFKVTDDMLNGERSGTMKNLAANDFSDFGEYMVRRAVVKSVAAVRSRKNKSVVPRAVGEFFVSLLSDDDNSQNDYDEDHYMADVIRCAAQVAVAYGSEEPDITSSILKLLQRHRLLDSMTPSRSRAVGAAIVVGIADVEVARMAKASSYGGTTDGLVPNSPVEKMLLCQLQPDSDILRHTMQLLRPPSTLVSVTSALSALARLYGGDLETLQWILSRADRSSNGDDVVAMLSSRKAVPESGIVEPVLVRIAALEAITGAAKLASWGDFSPILMALRRHTTRARQFSSRVFRLAMGDGDERVRSKSVELALQVWGYGVPVCLLQDHEYYREMSLAKTSRMVRVKKLKSQAPELASRGRIETRLGFGTPSDDSPFTKSGSHQSSKKKKPPSVHGDGSGVNGSAGGGSKNAKRSSAPPMPVSAGIKFRSSPSREQAVDPRPPIGVPFVPPRSAPSVPRSAPSVPRSAPSVPRSAPSVPRSAPSVPRSAPSAPRSVPSAPRSAPSAPLAKRDARVKITEEDRRYLKLAWEEHLEGKQKTARPSPSSFTSKPASSPFSSKPAPSPFASKSAPSLFASKPAPSHFISKPVPPPLASKPAPPPLSSQPAPSPFTSKPASVVLSSKPPSSPFSSKPRKITVVPPSPSSDVNKKDAETAEHRIGISVVGMDTGKGEHDEEQKKKKKKKKKRHREEGEDGGKKKKKKKKKRREDGEYSSSLAAFGGTVGSCGTVNAGGMMSSGSGAIPTSEGSIRSDGRRPTIKIKLGGTKIDGTKLDGTKSDSLKLSDKKPGGSKSDGLKPNCSKSDANRLHTSKSDGVQSGDMKSGSTRTNVMKSSGTKSSGAKSDGSKLGVSKSRGSKSGCSKPGSTKPSGVKSSAVKSIGEKSKGEKTSGDKSSGEKSPGVKSSGVKSRGVKSGGVKSSGVKSSGIKSSGIKFSGLKSSGTKSDGTRSGATKSGVKLGSKKSNGANFPLD